MPYWLVSLPLLKGRRDHTWELLQEKTSYGQQLSSNAKLEVPELRVGTIDTLLQHSDDLAKAAVGAEAIVAKIRRTVADIGGASAVAGLKVEGLPVEGFLSRFRWDEPKFPLRRPLKESLDKITDILARLEDDLKVKVGEYNTVKSQISAALRKAGGSLAVRDIAGVVSPGHVVDSENLTTLFVVVGKFGLKEWEASYESLADFVVPRSSVVVAEDADYALVRVVLFRRVADDFKTAARVRGFQVKEYVPPPPEQPDAPPTDLSLAQLRAEGAAKQAALGSWCAAAYGEAFSCLTHMAVVRLFVESILRYGLPPAFAAAVVRPLPKMEARLRAVLAAAFGTDVAYWKDDGAVPGGLGSELDAYPYAGPKTPLRAAHRPTQRIARPPARVRGPAARPAPPGGMAGGGAGAEAAEQPQQRSCGAGAGGGSAAWRPVVAALERNQLATEVLVSGLGVSCGTTLTNPIDVVKTRLQLRPGNGPTPGMVSTGLEIARAEGMLALWRGWVPAVARGMAYGGLRLGLYNPLKAALGDALRGDGGSGSSDSSGSSGSSGGGDSSGSSGSSGGGDSSGSSTSSGSGSGTSSGGSSGGGSAGAKWRSDLAVKLLAGVLSGSAAAALLSPTELIKVRLQAPGSTLTSSSQAIAAVVASDGVGGLWKGGTPGVVRAAVLTAAQCVTYDEAKRRVLAATGWADGAAAHLATALITGLVSTTATNPVDVIKTHMFVGGRAHSGPLACAASLYAAQGGAAFWRGWSANYARLGPQTVVTFLVVEQLRAVMGWPPLG
ncbi:VHA-C [Scenedesmus sp. PABB004]|nr:VHA-C [Scenedesmus sp. PABB004]